MLFGLILYHLVQTAAFTPLSNNCQTKLTLRLVDITQLTKYCVLFGLYLLGDTAHEEENIDMSCLPQHCDLIPEGCDLSRGWVADIESLDGHSVVPVTPVHCAK